MLHLLIIPSGKKKYIRHVLIVIIYRWISCMSNDKTHTSYEQVTNQAGVTIIQVIYTLPVHSLWTGNKWTYYRYSRHLDYWLTGNLIHRHTCFGYTPGKGKVVLPLSLKAKVISSTGEQAITSSSRSRVGNGPGVWRVWYVSGNWIRGLERLEAMTLF